MFRSDIRNKIFIMRVVRHWHCCPELRCSIPAVPRAMGGALGVVPMAGGGTGWAFPSNSIQPIVLTLFIAFGILQIGLYIMDYSCAANAFAF